MMDGRLKTLHPRVHGGLLAIRAEPAHQAAMIANDIRPIDLLVVNLYPFEAALERGAAFDDMIENIDIGGPAMIRAAAKNHDDVVVIVDVADYAALIDEMARQRRRHDGWPSAARMAQKAFARTAAYDAAISNWLARETGETQPAWRAFGGRLASALRYGENPHQRAAFYSRPTRAPASPPRARSRARSCPTTTSTTPTRLTNASPNSPSPQSRSSSTPTPAASPSARRCSEAYEKALSCDPVSAFGGVVALNRRLDAAPARKIVEIFTEVIIAPGRRRRGDGDRRGEEKPAAAARRRACPIRRRRA